MKELKHLNQYFAKYKYHFIGGIIATIVAQIFSLYTPELIGDSIAAIENYIKTGSKNPTIIKALLLRNILTIILTTFIAGGLTFLMRQTLIVMSRHIEFDLKNEIFRKYEILTPSFYKNNHTGDLMNRISEDVSRVRMYVGPAVMYTINTVIRFAVVIYYMFVLSPKLTFFTLLPLPILAFLIFKISSQINKKSTIFQKNLSGLSSFAQEIFSGIRIVKSYTIENTKNIAFEKLSLDSNTKSLQLAKTQALLAPLMLLLIGISNLLVIAMGGYMYINNAIDSIGVIAKFILYINMLVWPVASIGWVSSLVQEAEASQKRINEFLDLIPEIKNNNASDLNLDGDIYFDKVSLTYPDTNIQALKDVCFTIKKGQTVAIIGRTGSGKSTILALLARLYDATNGKIYLNNQDITTINLDQLRKNIAFVPQDSFLFSDTIQNNIKFGNQQASNQQIIDAAKNAAIHDSITGFKDQYQTVLGERGITLSGGQKQRVSIARALLKDSEILLLDDCLSAVDTDTEETILNNLDKITANKTTIIVSHRVSSVKNADKIIVLENGKIIAQGTHNELLSQEGYYKELFLKQVNEKEIT